MKIYDLLIFIGRFQPFHNGHLDIILSALKQSRRVLLLLGSAHQPRTPRAPFTVKEQEAMVRMHFSDDFNRRLRISPLEDALYNEELWISHVKKAVAEAVTASPVSKAKIGLIGSNNDKKKHIAEFFPEWQTVGVSHRQGLAETDFVNTYFSRECLQTSATKQLLQQWQEQEYLSPQSASFLNDFTQSVAYRSLIAEQSATIQYQRSWSQSPYPPIFVTVDALVIQSGHLLLIERKQCPGKGLFALPGGFIDPKEYLIDACLRELHEETRLNIPPATLKSHCSTPRVYDAPYRSARGRTITHAFLFHLNPSTSLPEVTACDDAAKAFWLPLNKISVTDFFEDHFFIIQNMRLLSD